MEHDIDYDPILFALAEKCPLHGGNPNDCQMNMLRQKSVLEKLEYIASLSEEEKVAMIECHQDCFYEQYNQVNPTNTAP